MKKYFDSKKYRMAIRIKKQAVREELRLPPSENKEHQDKQSKLSRMGEIKLRWWKINTHYQLDLEQKRCYLKKSFGIQQQEFNNHNKYNIQYQQEQEQLTKKKQTQ